MEDSEITFIVEPLAFTLGRKGSCIVHCQCNTQSLTCPAPGKDKEKKKKKEKGKK